jgi:glycosyltransferase involved in cell wall biosynthesis
MKIEIILCTHNRCQTLMRALESAAALVLPEEVEWQVLVVDNCSRDKTHEVVDDFCRRHPGRFRYLFEGHPGKSYALNTAIREARGDVLAFMDDDVTVDANWLQNLTAALHDGKWAGAGGRVIPEWSCPAPRWLSPKSKYASGPLVQFDLGDEAGELFEPPFGTNMAFRREMFEKYGNFLVELGPRPGSEIRNEDTEFGARLLSGRERLRYEPSAEVYHPVQEDRLRKEYFLAWWLHKGQANIRQFGVQQGTKYRIAGIPLYMLRRFAVWTLKWLVAIEPARRFSNRLSAWQNLGEILECYGQSNEAEKRKSFTA